VSLNIIKLSLKTAHLKLGPIYAHPNQYVDHYKIWRQVKRKNAPQPDPPQIIATVNRNTTSYTDYDYAITNGYTNDLAWYDARAHWTVNDTYADAQWYANFVQMYAKPQFAEGTREQGLPPEKYSVAAYPNPFNPTTLISYSIPKDGIVSLVIYDVQGRRVASLVERYQEAGYYSTTWNGNNSFGTEVSNGLYFARLRVQGANGGILHAQAIKLLLTK
jgi:hypothetical protein